jgi:ethanolamine utilization microcompartment shell protein EutS
MSAPSTRKSTRLTVAPPKTVGVAEIVIVEPTRNVVPAAGLETTTVGAVGVVAAAVTATLVAADVAVAPLESVTRAVREAVVALVGVHVAV